MYVCLCTGTTDRQIKQAVYAGARSLDDVREELGVASQCGQCSCLAKEIIGTATQELDEVARNALFCEAV